MARKYRVILERKSILEALLSNGGFRDCYTAQAQGLLGWRKIGTFPTQDEAEAACRDHAGGTLLSGGGRVVSEFERPPVD